MASKIQWTDETWNPVVGCSKVSAGCDNCYAERMAYRLSCIEAEKNCYRSTDDFINKYQRVVYANRGWNGKTFCDEKALDKPLHWKKPRRIFVCSMGDLFHESVPFEFITKVLRVVEQCPQHTFQVLTKRTEQMYDFFGGSSGAGLSVEPLHNLWLGVTIEHSDYLHRAEILLQIPATVRFVSIEPMLGVVDDLPLQDGGLVYKRLSRYYGPDGFDPKGKQRERLQPHLDWVIVGAESGPKARYCPIDNIRSIVEQCKAAGVPVFVKQIHLNGKAKAIKEIKQFPKELQVTQWPERK